LNLGRTVANDVGGLVGGLWLTLSARTVVRA
jgi:hypothetical protein